MKYSPKGQSPSCLGDWRALENTEWTPDWDNFAGPPKDGTYTALVEEQGHVCAYCGRRLNETATGGHIDHFWPRSQFPNRALDYQNFFASCGPPGKDRQIPSTCGDAKGQWFDPDNDIVPSHPECEKRFRYDLNGAIRPAAGRDAMATTVIMTLKLDDPALTEDRKKLLVGIETDIQAGLISSANKAKEIANWRTRDKDSQLKSLGHVAARYLEDEPL